MEISREKINKIIFLKLEFKDNGIGILDDLKKKIFQENRIVSRNPTSMGFGLSLIKRVLSFYKGFIRVEDKIPGDHLKGSNFIIYVPETIIS